MRTRPRQRLAPRLNVDALGVNARSDIWGNHG